MDESIGLRVLNPRIKTDRISTNEDAFRGPPIEQPKPAGRQSLAFMGASTTFCAEVSGDTEVWSQPLADGLRTIVAGAQVVPGYTVSSSRKSLRHRVARFEPDVIVIYHATNDLSGETRDLAMARCIAGAADSGRHSWLERRSLLWELVAKNLRVLNAQRKADASTRNLAVDESRLGASFEQELTQLVREAKAVGKVVVLATFSTRLRVEQSVEAKRQAAVSALVYMPFMTLDGLVASYTRYNNIIREVAQREGALLIRSANAVLADAAHFLDAVQFTDAGNRALAQRVLGAPRADARVMELIKASAASG